MAEEKDPMAVGNVTPAQEVKQKQGKAGWPKPGEEGFVHPDGTRQSEVQLEENRRAAADRAAAGSIIHGAPLGTPGPDPDLQTQRAVDRAADPDKAEPGAGYDDSDSRNTTAGE